MRRLSRLLGATVPVIVACSDPSGPNRGAGVRVISSPNASDTIGAVPTAALVVEVRTTGGAVVPQGTVVRFTAMAASTGTLEMLVQSLTANFFSGFAAATTDAAGRAGVLVQFGAKAGPARIAVSVPTIGVEDTARFTVLPGRPVGVTLGPRDTVMYVGRTLALRGAVVDRFGNARPDALSYSASGPGAAVSGTGVVTASATGRYRLTATLGTISATSDVSVVPQGTLATVRFSGSGLWISSVGLDGSQPRDLTAVVDGGIGPRPRWIPGTNKIIYSHAVGGRQVLRTVDGDGNVATFLPNPPSTMTHQAEPSPAANAPVVYFSAYDSRCSDFHYCLFRANLDGTAPEMLGNLISPDEATRHPASSPDGSRVAFVVASAWDIIRVFDYTTRTVSSWGWVGHHPSWSPDGRRIAYVRDGGGPLRVIDADGTNQRTVGPEDGAYYSRMISWSSDSKWLLARSAVWELIEVDTGLRLPLAFTADYQEASLK